MSEYFKYVNQKLKEGNQFGNDEWFTVNRIKDNIRCIYINGKYKYYKTMTSYTKAVVRLLNVGA